MAKIVVVNRGGGGVDEMRESVDPAEVMWAMVRFTFGSGTFKRDKFIFGHWIGEKVPVVKRAKLNNEKPNVQKVVSGAHADIELTAPEQVSVDYFFDRLNRVFVSDHGDFTIADLKKEYLKSVEETKALEAAEDAAQEPGSPKRKTASEFEEKIPAEKVLEAVKKPEGPFNWVLFEGTPGKLTLYDAGSLSLLEMCEKVPNDKVLYGLLRMGFGSGTFRRTKWVFIHWVGEKTPIVQKGRASQCKGEMQEKLKPFSVDLELGSAEDMEPAAFIKRVATKFVVDETAGGKKADKKDTEAAFGLDEFMAALKEETAAAAEFFGDPEPAAPGSPKAKPLFDLKESLDQLKTPGSAVNWVLLKTT